MPSDLWEVWISATVADADADLAGFGDDDGRFGRGASVEVGSVGINILHIKRYPDEAWQPSSDPNDEYVEDFNVWEGDFTIRRHTSDDVLHGKVYGDMYIGGENTVIGYLDEAFDTKHCPELDDT
ncbi:MAG: hypothetical protein H6739_32290 [Alphaproteobacteria bacterium]|nr:hypothetical protein [Alphaproteobacteria bacterium]